jgi:hypothetical protein
MKISQYGNVPAQLEKVRLKSHRRYVCLLDVLGMKSWLAASPSGEVAGALATALQLLPYVASGSDVFVHPVWPTLLI